VFIFKSRPLTGGMTAGLEEVLARMKAGGRCLCEVPASLGFGDKPYSFESTRHAQDKAGTVPASSTLYYEVELQRVSVAP
jgi:FKBP-type peptidyl-prolyl cis-trans isomerase